MRESQPTPQLWETPRGCQCAENLVFMQGGSEGTSDVQMVLPRSWGQAWNVH